MYLAHGSVNSQVFSADRQTANRDGTGNSGSVAAASPLLSHSGGTLCSHLHRSCNAHPFTPPTHWQQTRSSAGSSLCWKIHHLKWMPWAFLTSLILVLCTVLFFLRVSKMLSLVYCHFFILRNPARCLEEFSAKYFHVAQDQMCLLWLCTIFCLNKWLWICCLRLLWSLCGITESMLPPISSLLMVTFLPFCTSVIVAAILTIKQPRTHAEHERRSTALELYMEK